MLNIVMQGLDTSLKLHINYETSGTLAVLQQPRCPPTIARRAAHYSTQHAERTCLPIHLVPYLRWHTGNFQQWKVPPLVSMGRPIFAAEIIPSC